MLNSRRLLNNLLAFTILASPAWADMYPDGSNAKLPAAGMPASSACTDSSGKLLTQSEGCDGFSAKAFGAIGDGVAVDTAAVQACLNKAADGRVCRLQLGHSMKYNLTGGITIPRGATLDCGLHSMADVTPPMLPSSSWGGAIMLDTTHPILFNDTSARVQNCTITPVGMVFPQASSSWAGTAIDTNGRASPQIYNTTIVGFDTCIDTTTNGGSQRPYLARLYLDCTGKTIASLNTGNNGDIATLQDIKLQVLGTSAQCPDRLRAGNGLNIVGSAWIDNLVWRGFPGRGDQDCWCCAGFFWQGLDRSRRPRQRLLNSTSAGVYMQGVQDIDFSHLDIQGVQNGIQLVYQAAGRSVHIGDLWLNSIANDGVQMGLPATAASGGVLIIDSIRINAESGGGVKGFAVNITDQTLSSYLRIGGGTLAQVHNGIAPYIATGGETASHFDISDRLVTDLGSPYTVWGGETVTSCTGNGSGGCGLLNSFRTTPWAGVVRVTAAGTTTANGAVQITWPMPFDNASNCAAAYRSETTTSGWPVLYPLTVFDSAPNITQINWGTSGNLPTGKSYDIAFECHAPMTGWIEADGLPLAPVGELPPANCEGDIRIVWDNTQALGDWALAEGDLQTRHLETACLVSLFSDALATPDFRPTDGTTDRRGWWADYYQPTTGSNLWQLDRAKTTRANLGLAQSTVQQCLQWLIDDGVVASIVVNTQYITANMMGIAIALTKPDGTQTRFMFGWAWTGLATVPSPVRMVAPFG